MAQIGTLEWLDRTGGLLSSSERARLLAGYALRQARHALARLGRSPAELARIEPDELVAPDSRAARAALAEAGERAPAHLLAHSWRSFLFARAFGAARRVGHDRELLFVAAILHDVGLAQPCPQRCFTLPGVAAARAALPGDRGERAAEAISLHLNPSVGLEHGPEAHLAHAGIWADAAGFGLHGVDEASRSRATAAHPRDDFDRRALGLLRERGADAPASRAAVLGSAARLAGR